MMQYHKIEIYIYIDIIIFSIIYIYHLVAVQGLFLFGKITKIHTKKTSSTKLQKNSEKLGKNI
jgi:hypothetical protein